MFLLEALLRIDGRGEEGGASIECWLMLEDGKC